MRRRKKNLKRRILIGSIFVVILGIVAPIMILLTLGYRFDRDKGVFVHSGSIVLKTTPNTVDININGKPAPENSVDFINRAYNLGGLRPALYDVEVSTEGYFPWKKKAEVHSGIATEFWNVVLVPEKINKVVLEEEKVLGYAFSPDKKELALFIDSQDKISLFIIEENNRTLVYQEPYNQQFSPLIGELKWSPNGDYLIFSFSKNNKETVFLTDKNSKFTNAVPLSFFWKYYSELEEAESEIIVNDYTDKIGIKSFYSWKKKDTIYYTLNEKLYSHKIENLVSDWRRHSEAVKNNSLIKINFNTQDNYPIGLTENVISFTFCGNLICEVDSDNQKVNFLEENGDKKGEVNLSKEYKITDEYEILAYGDDRLALIDRGKNLFVWDREEGELIGANRFKYIFSGVKEAYFSDDGKKLLFSTPNEVYTYFLREWEVQPKHKKGDLELIYRQDEEIKTVQWYRDYQHAFIVLEDEIKLIELDGRWGRNVFTFLKSSYIDSVVYDTREGKLWYIQGENKGDNLGVCIGERLKEISFPISQTLLPSF